MNPQEICSNSDEDEDLDLDFDLDEELFGGEARGGAMSTAEPSTVPKRRAADAGLLTGRFDEEEEGSDDPYSSGDDIIAAYRARPMAPRPPTTTASTDVAQTTSPELDLLAHTAFGQAAWAPYTLGMKAKVAGEGERIEDMQLCTSVNFGFELIDDAPGSVVTKFQFSLQK